MADRPPDWLNVHDARAAILRGLAPLPPEHVPLLHALGRVLAEDVVSPIDLPRWDNSGMDGYAVHSDDVRGATDHSPRTLRLVDDVPAGARPARAVGRGEAIRVMTGAPVPEGADGVVRVEHTDGGGRVGGTVEIRSDADAGRNVRRTGEDLRAGRTVLVAGTVLGPAEIGVAASVGCAVLSAVRRPRVAILTSGDELVEVERFEEVRAGRRIVSSNSYSLAAQVLALGMEPVPLGIAADTPDSLRRHLERAAGCDVLITSAGISVGAHDHVRAVLAELDTELVFWRVRMKPGSPCAFGRIGRFGGIPWFGLPGNPVSSMVTFELFARPALRALAGHRAVFRPTVQAQLRDLRTATPAGLTQLLRVRLTREQGGWVARPTGEQGSGILSSMAAADGLLVLSPDGETHDDDQRHPVILLGDDSGSESPGY